MSLEDLTQEAANVAFGDAAGMKELYRAISATAVRTISPSVWNAGAEAMRAGMALHLLKEGWGGMDSVVNRCPIPAMPE